MIDKLNQKTYGRLTPSGLKTRLVFFDKYP